MSSSRCARLAISGTTPPNRACRSTWLETTDERTVRPPQTSAAAVSSHDVSIPRIGASEDRALVTEPSLPGSRLLPFRSAPCRELGDDGVDATPVRLPGDVPRPHDDGVLARLGVV